MKRVTGTNYMTEESDAENDEGHQVVVTHKLTWRSDCGLIH